MKKVLVFGTFDGLHKGHKYFVEALEYGMPPTCGFGIGGERLFAFLMNKPARETQIFPLMKPKNL